MDVKDLNKFQLLLLAVLLSFVTSIATGITTVTLMQQAPASFTVPVNRVVQQTIEKIQQVEGKTTVQTVIIKEEDLVVDAIAKNSTAVFAVSKDGSNADGQPAEISVGRGFAISTSGVIVVDATQVLFSDIYYVKNASGKFKADFISTEKEGFSFIKIGAPVNGTDQPVFTVPAFGDLSKMKIGQKILVLGDSISSFIFEGNTDIKMSVTKSNGGALVLNIDGNALGMALSGETSSFVSIDAINNVFKVSIAPSETLPASPILAQ